MYFLHQNPELAAASLCERDIQSHFEMALAALHVAHYGKSKYDCPTNVTEWLDADGFNYHWMAYFAERLSLRLANSSKYWTEIASLRREVPTRLPCKELTLFPIYDKFTLINLHQAGSLGLPSLIAAYRADYVHTRWKYAEWSTAPAPGWFFRVANTILPPDSREDFLSRVQPPRPGSPDDEGSTGTQREDVRDGPSCEIDGGPTGKCTLW